MSIALDATSIARALGGDALRGGALVPGPGHSKHDRSLRVFVDLNAPDGFRTHSYAGANWQDCRDHVKERLGIDTDTWRDRDRDQEVKAEPVKYTFRAPDPESIRHALLTWWQGVDPRGTPVETYLHSRRLELDDAVCGDVIRVS